MVVTATVMIASAVAVVITVKVTPATEMRATMVRSTVVGAEL